MNEIIARILRCACSISSIIYMSFYTRPRVPRPAAADRNRFAER
jgi:hypothetical protein